MARESKLKRELKITRVEAIPFGIPIKGFADAYTSFSSSNAVLVKIHASDGTVGYGEACAWEPEFYGETLESVTSSIETYIGPKIIGENPFDIHRILTKVDAAMARVTCAKEGIDLALFDLVGRVLDVPVTSLLHGRFRELIPIASEIGIDTPNAMAENARTVIRMGIPCVKIKGSSDIEEDVRRVKAVRKAVGKKIKLRLDPNAHWDTSGTIWAMKELKECNLEYLEQPVPGPDLNGMARIRRAIDIPLMADEGVWTPEDVLELARREAVDIINIKISKTGGLLKAKRVEAVADALGLPCVVGTEIEPGFSLAAKLHLAASMKHLHFACEFTELSLLEESVLKPNVEIEKGCVRVPKSPGLGFELNNEVLAKREIRLTIRN
jgi:L-alanine-DL-glutamate epimerase-like enolase superfamily enzyme